MRILITFCQAYQITLLAISQLPPEQLTHMIVDYFMTAKWMASTKLTYLDQLLGTVTMIASDVKMSIIKKLKHQLKVMHSKEPSRRAPAYPKEVVENTFRKAYKDEAKEFEFMLQVSWLTAARLGDLHFLHHVQIVPQGWRVRWIHHKGDLSLGPVDVLLPWEILPESVEQMLGHLKAGQLFLEAKCKLFYKMFYSALGLTYSLRRSALQWYHYTLGWSHEQILQISLHSTTRPLMKYLSDKQHIQTGSTL